MMLNIFGIVVWLVGILFGLVALDSGGWGAAAAVGFMSLALTAFIARALLVRWDRFAAQKWNVTKETKDNG